MFDGFLVDVITNDHRVKPAFRNPAELTVEYIGPAREGRGEAGGLYRGSNGMTYFVPTVQMGNQALPVVAEAEEVISNPTGFYDDMLFISISSSLMARGLRTALENASLMQIEIQNKENFHYC